MIQDEGDTICLAGKNDIAVDCLAHLIEIGIKPERLCVVLNKDDLGRSTWQHSLGFHAQRSGVKICTLESVKPLRNLWFFSVEFDRLLKPSEFACNRLFNIHFSKLPAYRGVSTSVWPILRGESESGVTFHRIDAGIDTGPVLHQRVFRLGADWTARDLYFRYLKEGVSLFRESIAKLRSGEAEEIPQDDSAASLFRRRDIDFGNLALDYAHPASRLYAQIRAYTFWEYQLPKVDGRKVWSANILPGPASGVPGSFRPIGAWRGVVSASDADLEVRFSPYDELYAWAAGESASLPELTSVPDVDLQDVQEWSAMMKEANGGNVSALNILADAGASVSKANRRGTTPLMYAFNRMITKGDDSAFRALLDLGADPRACDQHGRSINDYVPEQEKARLASSYPTIFR